MRRDAEREGDARQDGQLRVLGNALVYGQPARFDTYGKEGIRPGPWCFPPIAATVAAGCRCLLAMLDHCGGEDWVIPHRDTDGALIAAPRRCDVLETLSQFDALSPLGESFWKVMHEHDGQPLYAIVWGGKRHALFVNPDEPRIVSSTEHVLGAYSSPPGHGGRRDDGRHTWTEDVARAHVAHAYVPQGGTLPPFAWEESAPGFPELRRTTLSGPDALSRMPQALGLRPFSRIVEATPSYQHRDVHPVATDPGGELPDPARLPWYDSHRGEPIAVTTNPTDLGAVVLNTLRARAVGWVDPIERGVLSHLILDPLLARRRGRISGEYSDGIPGIVHPIVDSKVILMTAARLIGVPGMKQLCNIPERTLRAMASGRAPNAATVRDALRDLSLHFQCADPLPSLLDVARSEPTSCRLPGCDAVARRRSVTCSERHRKALARLLERDGQS